MASVDATEYNFHCQKCPRTFKLQEFYEKHQKVHLLKKQHVCKLCGFVYGAAKGLEGHMETAHSDNNNTEEEVTNFNNNNSCKNNNNNNGPEDLTQNKAPVVRPKLCPSAPIDLSQMSQSMPEMSFLHFLQAQGALSSTDLLKQAHQAILAQAMNNQNNNREQRETNAGVQRDLGALNLAPITISAPTSPNQGSPNSVMAQKPNDKSKIPSPAGTGNYKIYDEVPEIQDASDAQQNDSGFFSCTICSREFSGLNSLKKHVPIHTRRVQHKCDTCGYVFGKKEYLLDHMRKHTGEVSPVCEVCGQTFNKSLKLKEHLKLHRNTTHDGHLCEHAPYKCHICKQCFSTPGPLGDHLRSAHSETVYKCDMCDATFGDVRGKNHHMYNEHQLDAFHQKCVWCPVCNQGFTRHYNLKVHMYKSHGKEYLEANFSQHELDSIMRPPPGSNTSKPSPTPRKRSDEEIVIPGTPTGVLPISPPLTPKLSPKQRMRTSEDSPTMVPSNSCIPSANILKANLQRPAAASNSKGAPASRTKPRHYFDQEAQHSIYKCTTGECEEKFLRKTDLFIHLQQHSDCQQLALTSSHGHSESDSDGEHSAGETGRVHAQERSSAPSELVRASPRDGATSNLPQHLATQCQEAGGNGFPCEQCGKVLMHKQSYVSHMRVIHGDYYGGNKWKGSSVVEMVLGAGKAEDKSRDSPVNLTVLNDAKSAMDANNPNLNKRIQAFKAALGLNDSDEPDTKRIKLDYKGILKDQNENSLSSYSVLSFSSVAHPAPLSGSTGSSPQTEDQPLDLACRQPVSLNVDIEEDDDEEEHDEHLDSFPELPVPPPGLSNNLLQIARPLNPARALTASSSSPPCSPLNLHISRPNSPSQTTASQPSHCPSNDDPSPIVKVSSQPLPQDTDPSPPPLHTQASTQGDGQEEEAEGGQPKLHEYLVKQSHATSDENGRKKFLCPVCKCQLSWKTNLSVHLRTHSGERPFQCVLCLNRFRQKAHLYKHFRCSHGHKVAPYKCPFCTETFTRSPNDLYNHITEVHKRETDELTNNNNLSNNNNFKEESDAAAEMKMIEHEESKDDEDAKIQDLSQATKSQEQEEAENLSTEDVEVEEEPKDREDDSRFEAEEFEYKGKLIKPSYCVLPLVTDDEVEPSTKRNIAPEEYSEDEEGQMVIDEGPLTPENLVLNLKRSPSLSPKDRASPAHININNNELKINSFGQGFANAINICRREEEPQPRPTHTVKFEPLNPALYYPAVFPDFSLPFSLSGLIQKKKAEMAAILAPRLSPKSEAHTGCHGGHGGHKLTLDHLAKAAMASSKAALSPTKSESGASNTAVSEYENQIQNDMWPIDCIKCNAVLTSLDNFNIHMNDHWSDDKCCPVCGLLINSKRFNFKQHLKIHTGEKPFVCQVCNRAFRQKAHMVKHVTTHRSEPRGLSESVYSHGPVAGAGSKRSISEAFQPGVIVQ